MKPINASHGFTLMEVLVALTIISIAFTTIFMSISSNARNLFYLQNKTAANWVALNIITEVQLGLLTITEKNSHASNIEYMFDQPWYWDASVQATTNPYISRIDVNVKKSSTTSNIIHLVGYLRNDT